jgi:hypothetical protein
MTDLIISHNWSGSWMFLITFGRLKNLPYLCRSKKIRVMSCGSENKPKLKRFGRLKKLPYLCEILWGYTEIEKFSWC